MTPATADGRKKGYRARKAESLKRARVGKFSTGWESQPPRNEPSIVPNTQVKLKRGKAVQWREIGQ